MSRVLRSLIAVTLGVGASNTSGGPPSVPANPRELPSLVQRWTWTGQAESAVFADGVIYVRGNGRVTALNGDNGKVLWETVCAQGDDLMGKGPVVTGDSVAVSFNDDLVLLDRKTGRAGKTLELGVIFDITASPLLVVAAGKNDRVDLVRIDAESGEVLARREVGGIVYDVQPVHDVAIAIVGRVSPAAEGSDDEEMLAGYRTGDLAEIWRRDFQGSPHLERLEEAVYAALLKGEGEESHYEYRRVDPVSGELGPALPQRLRSEVSGGLTWELEVTGLKDGKAPARLRRNSFETGRPLWTVELPGDPGGWVREGNSLYLHTDHEGGRGYLIVLDWATGAVKQAAYGLRDVRGLFSNRDSITAWLDGGLTTFSADRFGRPEAQSRNVREEVVRILRGVADGDFPSDRREDIQAAFTDLKALGRRAIPFVAEQVPALTPPALVAASRVLADARYREAAGSLALRLADQPPPARTDWDRWDPAFDVLNALSQIGGDPEVGAVAAILNDPTRDGATRRQALATLASMGTPGATTFIAKALSQKAVVEQWFQPPSPQDFVEFVGRRDLKKLEALARDRQDWDQVQKIDQAADSALLPLPEGGTLLVFHGSRLGGHKDVWVADVDAAGRVASPSRFIGGAVEGPIHASLDGDVLVLERTSTGGPVRIGLSETAKDSDGDGLPDLVELRLKTDPRNPDSDADRLPGFRRPRSERGWSAPNRGAGDHPRRLSAVLHVRGRWQPGGSHRGLRFGPPVDREARPDDHSQSVAERRIHRRRRPRRDRPHLH